MFGQLAEMLDLGELVRRAIKYIVEGLVIAIAAFVIPSKGMKLDEVLLIALSGAATFSILDTFVPSIASATRNGAGMGIGFNMVSFPRM